MKKFLAAYPSSLASDLDGAPVFLATSAFNLRYEQERWPKIAFADVKDYQKAALWTRSLTASAAVSDRGYREPRTEHPQ